MASKHLGLLIAAFFSLTACTSQDDSPASSQPEAKPQIEDAAEATPSLEPPFEPKLELQKVARLGKDSVELRFDFEKRAQSIEKKLKNIDSRISSEPSLVEFNSLTKDFEKLRIELLDLNIATEVLNSEYDLLQLKLSLNIQNLRSECLKSAEVCKEIEPFLRGLEQLTERFSPKVVPHDFEPDLEKIEPLEIEVSEVEEQIAAGFQSSESFRRAEPQRQNQMARLMKKMSELEARIVNWGSKLHSVE